MRVVITGAEGVVGTVLRTGLANRHEVHALTRRAHPCSDGVADVTDPQALMREFRGADAVVHLAAAAQLDAGWDDVLAANINGTRNVFEASLRCGVRRVVFASSGHVLGLAEERAGSSLYALEDARAFDENTPCEPDSLYAVSKVFGEALGRHHAEAHGLSVISIRIGTVLPDDNPRSDNPGNGRSGSMSLAERYPRIRAKWLSHRDCVEAFHRAIVAEKVTYATVFATSDNPRKIWSLEGARRVLGFVPRDAAPVDLNGA